MDMTKKAYEEVVAKDSEWLINNTEDTLERDPILILLKKSIKWYYPDASNQPEHSWRRRNF